MDESKELYYQREVGTFLKAFVKREAVERDSEYHSKKLDTVQEQEISEVREKLTHIFEAQLHKLKSGEDKTKDEVKFGLLHPIIIEEALIKTLNFSDTENEHLFDIIRKSYPIDRKTGLYSKHCAPLLLGLAHLCAQENPKKPICVVRGDFTNMRQSNDKEKGGLGKEHTDKALRQICDLLMKESGGDKIEVQGCRVGGDEVGLIVYGRTAQQMQKILDERVHPEINLLSAQYGVHNLVHAKAGKLPGFGAAFACTDLAQDKKEIGKRLEEGIDKQKWADGALRYGLVTEKRLEDYIEKIYTPALFIKGDYKPGLVKEERQERHPLIEQTIKHWKALSEGFYRERVNSVAQEDAMVKTDPKVFFDHQLLSSEERNRRLDETRIDHLAPAKERIPGWGYPTIHIANESPEVRRMRQVLKMAEFPVIADGSETFFHRDNVQQRFHLDGITKELAADKERELRMVVDLMNLFEASDPVTRCKSDHLMLDDATDIIERNKGMKVLHFELVNLNGLNAVDERLANAVLREFCRFIRESLKAHPHDRGEHIADYLYHEGNGEFKVFLPPDYPDDLLAQVESDVARKFQEHIASKSIFEFALDTFARMAKNRLPGESKKIIKGLQEKTIGMFAPSGLPLTRMEEIPHPRNRKGVVGTGVNVYHATIKSDALAACDPETIEEELVKITKAADESFKEKEKEKGPTL